MGWYRTVHNFGTSEDIRSSVLTLFELYPQKKWISYHNIYISTLGIHIYLLFSSLTVSFGAIRPAIPHNWTSTLCFSLKVVVVCDLLKNIIKSCVVFSYSTMDNSTCMNVKRTLKWHIPNLTLCGLKYPSAHVSQLIPVVC